ncbi:MAG: molecular chaperone [Proteobacteria bacterium]|nr:molecular chaperone [Pseudomonadota bacterium]
MEAVNMKKFFSLIVVLSLLVAAQPSWARNAGLLVSPTRVVMQNGKRFATVTVRNNGDATGRYKVELVDTIMNEEGGIKIREDGSKDEFSAIDMITLSPRSMTLKPDANQNVRILVRSGEDIPDGEYKSHLQIRMTDSNAEPKTEGPTDKGVGIALQTKMITVIPIIIRKGETSYKVSMDDVKLLPPDTTEKSEPKVKVLFGFSGNRSVLADVKVVHTAANGKETQLAFFRGVAIYRGVSKRSQIVPLKVPAGLDIHKGKLQVSFVSQEDEGSQVLASKDLTP